MNRSFLLRRLDPRALVYTLRKRGVSGLAHHALRRLGTLRGRALAAPEKLTINPVGVVCNHSCPMCWLQHLDSHTESRMKREEREAQMTIDDYRRLFASVPRGLQWVMVAGGGEPLLHPDIVEILGLVKKRGWKGELITNGSRMMPALSKALVDMRWDLVRISLHAADRETFAAIHGADRFDDVRRNVEHYNELRAAVPRKRRPRLGLFFVIQPENVDQIERLYEFALELGTDFVTFDKVTPLSDDRQLTADQVRGARRVFEKLAGRSELSSNAALMLGVMQNEAESIEQEKPYVPAKCCSMGYDETYVTSIGEIITCCMGREIVGNARTDDFRDVWNGAAYAGFRERLMRGEFADYCISARCSKTDVLHN